MTTINFDQVRPGDTIGYFHTMEGIKGRYWKNRYVTHVYDGHFVLKGGTKVYPENIVGDITRMDPPHPWSIEDRQGDSLHVGYSADTVTLTIPGYGVMPFDIEDIQHLIDALKDACTEAEIKGLVFKGTRYHTRPAFFQQVQKMSDLKRETP